MKKRRTMEKLWDTEDLALYLGKNPQWVRENITHLSIPAYKVGKHWRFKQSEIQTWLETS
jgi:excisionase family DNA binding protein